MSEYTTHSPFNYFARIFINKANFDAWLKSGWVGFYLEFLFCWIYEWGISLAYKITLKFNTFADNCTQTFWSVEPG